jgi:hypothetical protein
MQMECTNCLLEVLILILMLTIFRFRWASLQLQSLAELKDDADILLHLGKVPPTLKQLYLEIYQIILTNRGENSQKIAQNSFDLLLGAKDDFTIETFLAFVTPDKGHPISLPELLDICCNMIVLDETSNIIRFAHTSVLEFLEGLPEFKATKVHSRISSTCLDLVDSWIVSGLSVWSWIFDPMGRYTNNYLRYHLREAGSQERVEVLLSQLESFLRMGNFVTLDDRSRQFWKVIRSPPDHVDHSIAWIFNACAFGFHEIVEHALESSRLQVSQDSSEARQHLTHAPHGIDTSVSPAYQHNDSSLVFDNSQMRSFLTPATCTCLALHAIRCQSYPVLAMLIEKRLWAPSDDLLLQPTCACASVLGAGPVYAIQSFYGLKYVSHGLVRDLVRDGDIRGDGEFDPTAKDRPLVVQDLIANGLVFPVDTEFLSNVHLSNSRWALESVALLLENDSNFSLSTDVIEAMIVGFPYKTLLQSLFRKCQRNGISQEVFEDIGSYCHKVEIFDWMRNADPSLSLTEGFLIRLFRDNHNDYVLPALLLRRWTIEEASMTPRVLAATIESAYSPWGVQDMLQRYPHLRFTPPALKALMSRWKFDETGFTSSPTMLSLLLYLNTNLRGDFQASQLKLLEEARQNGTESEIKAWIDGASVLLGGYKWYLEDAVEPAEKRSGIGNYLMKAREAREARRGWKDEKMDVDGSQSEVPDEVLDFVDDLLASEADHAFSMSLDPISP